MEIHPLVTTVLSSAVTVLALGFTLACFGAMFAHLTTEMFGNAISDFVDRFAR